MIARLFKWTVKTSIYVGIGAAAVYFYPQYSQDDFFIKAKATAEDFIAKRTVTEVAEVEVTPPAIRVAKVTSQELVETIAATGTINAREIALVGADVAGLKVLEVRADIGDTVQKGDILAVLDRSNLDLQLSQIEAQNAQIDANLAQAEAQVSDAQVAVKQAADQLARTKKLVAQKVVSPVQLENTQNALDSAAARQNSAEQGIKVVNSQRAVLAAQRRQIELQIEKTNIVAPVGGLVLNKNISIGAVVSGGAGPLFQIAENSAFELAAEVPESILANVAIGMKANVSIGGGKPFDAVVGSIDPTIDPRSRLGKVNILLPQTVDARAGSFATGNIETVRRQAIAVPSGSLLYNGEQPFLQVVKDGTVSSRMVEIGIRANNMVEIVQGLEISEEIVATAGTFVSDGDKVRPIPVKDQTAAVQ